MTHELSDKGREMIAGLRQLCDDIASGVDLNAKYQIDRVAKSQHPSSPIESIVLQAVNLYGGQADGMFTSATFSAAWKAHFKAGSLLDGNVVTRIIESLPFVMAMPGGCHWLYRPIKGETP